MKKAIIATGGKQYIVTEGETLDIELVDTAEQKSLTFEALLVIDGDKTTVGTPVVSGSKVTAEILAEDVAGEKVIAIRYKPKKRVRKIHGHRQHHTQIKITAIS